MASWITEAPADETTDNISHLSQNVLRITITNSNDDLLHFVLHSTVVTILLAIDNFNNNKLLILILLTLIYQPGNRSSLSYIYRSSI